MSKSHAEQSLRNFKEHLSTWQAVVDLGVFTLRDISAKLKISIPRASRHIRDMFAAGAVQIRFEPDGMSGNQSTNVVYSSQPDEQQSSDVPPWSRNAWRTMCVLSRFTAGEIMKTLPGVHTGHVDRAMVHALIEELCRLDVLRQDGYSPSQDDDIYALKRETRGIPTRGIPGFDQPAPRDQSSEPKIPYEYTKHVDVRVASSVIADAERIQRVAKWERHYLKKVNRLIPGYTDAELTISTEYDRSSRSVGYDLNGRIYIAHTPEGAILCGEKKALKNLMGYLMDEPPMPTKYYHDLCDEMRSDKAKERYPRSFMARMRICHQKREQHQDALRERLDRKRALLERSLIGRELVVDEEMYNEIASFPDPA